MLQKNNFGAYSDDRMKHGEVKYAEMFSIKVVCVYSVRGAEKNPQHYYCRAQVCKLWNVCFILEDRWRQSQISKLLF